MCDRSRGAIRFGASSARLHPRARYPGQNCGRFRCGRGCGPIRLRSVPAVSECSAGARDAGSLGVRNRAADLVGGGAAPDAGVSSGCWSRAALPAKESQLTMSVFAGCEPRFRSISCALTSGLRRRSRRFGCEDRTRSVAAIKLAKVGDRKGCWKALLQRRQGLLPARGSAVWHGPSHRSRRRRVGSGCRIRQVSVAEATVALPCRPVLSVVAHVLRVSAEGIAICSST